MALADAKKAGNDSDTARRILSPQLFTGMLACSQYYIIIYYNKLLSLLLLLLQLLLLLLLLFHRLVIIGFIVTMILQ